jgi:predicted dithiol-disulfide oxidoreductase (DUF899 family)
MAVSEIQRYPSGASEEYKKARDELVDAEFALSKQVEKVAELRRQLPQGAIMKDYTFQEGPDKSVTLAELGADGRSVVVQHLMFDEKDDEPCGMCALWTDGFNGIATHAAEHCNFVVVGKAPVSKLRDYAAKRGWTKIRILSSAGTDFNSEMKMENPPWFPDANQMPGVSVFKKGSEGEMRHVYTGSAHFIDQSTERGMDLLSPLWNLLDIIPEGRGKFYASNKYD